MSPTGDSKSNWGRWGAEDERGTLNLIGTHEVQRAIAGVSAGRVLRLDQPLGPDTAVPPHRRRPERFMTRDGGDYAAGARKPGGFQFAEEVVSFAAHSGTHLDALSHAWYGDMLYNGFPSTTVRSTSGAQRCGAEKLGAIVTRGVLLDVVAVRGRVLEFGEVITVDDLRSAADLMECALEPGDVVLIRTGWFESAGGSKDYFDGEPGIGIDAARWLADLDIALVGADNYAVEALPSSDGVFPVHQFLIRDCGTPLLEGLVLDELAREVRAPFLFVGVPLQLVGGTAGPISPIAMF
jgi:kynurenine formamidase